MERRRQSVIGVFKWHRKSVHIYTKSEINLSNYFLHQVTLCSIVSRLSQCWLLAAFIKIRADSGNTPVCHFASVSFVSIGHRLDLDTFYWLLGIQQPSHQHKLSSSLLTISQWHFTGPFITCHLSPNYIKLSENIFPAVVSPIQTLQLGHSPPLLTLLRPNFCSWHSKLRRKHELTRSLTIYHRSSYDNYI